MVGSAYLCVFGSILYFTRGLPYGIDNNESFSSLWHARHLYDTPLRTTFGLADEVFAWHQAASPFVHTHQGNFPRIFAFLLYLLGARTIESQIVLTTLSVGFATIWLAYRFLCTIGPPLFASLCCLVLITDYGLFGQWHVDTYRVWYGFFFFGSLLWVSKIDRKRTLGITCAGVAGFTAMFYGEYVFAAFVGTLAGLYALSLYYNSPRNLIRAWLVIGAGGILAGSILAAQLIAYMGWANVKLDVKYTLAARNMASDPSFTSKVDRFYQSKKIIFWHNYYDTANVRTVSAFVSSLLSKHLQFYGTWVALSAIVLVSGVFLGALFPEFLRRPRKEEIGTLKAAARLVAFRATPALFLLLMGYFTLTRVKPQFGDPIVKPWTLIVGLPPPEWLGGMSFFLSVILAAVVAFKGTQRLFGISLGRVFVVSACAALAYAFVYRAFTGYIYSGYLNRQAPFLVFWTDCLLGTAIFSVCELTSATLIASLRERSPAILSIAGTVLLASFVAAWFSIQYVYLAAVPINGEAFIKSFAEPPIRGHSFVVNNYPAPEAEKAHSWAYAESSLFSGRIQLTPEGFVTEHDSQYLWFADGSTNPAYRKPDYGLLINHPSSLAQALELYSGANIPSGSVGLPTVGLVRRATEALPSFFNDRLVATDGVNFSLVRFDWDFPPYLRPVDRDLREAARAMPFDQKFAVSEENTESQRRWRVTIAPAFSSSVKVARNAPTQLISAELDHRPLFAEEQLAGAGWIKLDSGRWIGVPGIARTVSVLASGDFVSVHLLAGPRQGDATVVDQRRGPNFNFMPAESRGSGHIDGRPSEGAFNRHTEFFIGNVCEYLDIH